MHLIFFRGYFEIQFAYHTQICNLSTFNIKSNAKYANAKEYVKVHYGSILTRFTNFYIELLQKKTRSDKSACRSAKK